MKNLKSVLEEDHSKKTKSELIEVLSGLESALTPAVYEQISGISPAELGGLTKKEILDVIEAFKAGYNPEWESWVTKASAETLKLIFGQMAEDDKLFATSDAANADFAAELGSIDFATIIGGPLDACVTAQANASISTVSFINEVGFEGEDGSKKLRMAEFKYKKSVPDEENPSITKQVDTEISVPFIALLNIPSFRIETCEIDFNVKLNSTYTKDTSSEFGLNVGTSGKICRVKFNVDVSYKRTSSTGVKVEKEYSLGVKVRATNDEMPAGLEKVLGLLGA